MIALIRSTTSTVAGVPYWSEWEAADGGRTRDLKLGKLALYQLSYRRMRMLQPAS